MAQTLTWAVVVAVIGFYFWTVAPESPHYLVSRDSSNYYNHLARGFLKGQLSLDVPDDPVLAALANPYDPVQRAGRGLHDASYYKGRFYIYFGVTPVLVLFLPARVLTGWFVNENLAVLLFCATGFLVSVALLRAIVRRHFAEASASLQVASVLALGLATMVPSLLRRPSVWEVPIACGFLFFMLTLYCLWRAMERGGRKGWMALASLAMGLCVGARPVYLFSCVILLVPAAWAAQAGGRGFWRQRDWWKLVAWAVGPVAATGLGLALYNYLRFDNPLEFGQNYQLAGLDVTQVKFFSAQNFFYNLRIYLCSTPGLTPYFPFLTVISPPLAPPGHLGVENPYGLLAGMPWVLFALGALVPALRPRNAAGWWCGAAWAGVIATAGAVSCFSGAAGRYQVDFTPGLVLLGAVDVLALSASLRRPAARGLLVAVAWLLALWSAGFNVLASLQHNRLLFFEHPQVYERVARMANHLPYWIDRLTGHPYGPVELRVIFPRGREGKVEPLVVTGREFLADYVYVHYLAQGKIRLALEHTSRGNFASPPLEIDPDAEHTVTVSMSSLSPPAAYPVRAAPAQAGSRQPVRTARIFLDGREVLQARVDCYDSAERTPSIGTSGMNRPGFKEDFSGRVLGWRRVPEPATAPVAGRDPSVPQPAPGLLHLTLKLPDFTGKRSEPLLCTGDVGKGDLIYLTYLDADHLLVGHDHWGVAATESPSRRVDRSAPLDIVISCPPLVGERGATRVEVSINGQVVLAHDGRYHESTVDSIAVLANPIGASTAGVGFTGEVIRKEFRQR